METESTVVESNKSSTAKVRSSFTMSQEVFNKLKDKATTEKVSVSSLIEKAVTVFVGG